MKSIRRLLRTFTPEPRKEIEIKVANTNVLAEPEKKAPNKHAEAVSAMRAALKSKDAKATLECAKRLIRFGSRSPSSWKLVCTLLQQANTWDLIPLYLSKAKDDWKNNGDVLLMAARAERKMHHFEQSAEFLELGLERIPTVQRRLELGLLFLDTDKLSRVVETITNLLADAAGQPSGVVLLKNLAKKDPKLALDVLASETREDQHYEAYRTIAAEINGQMGNHTEATAIAAEVLSRNPDNTDAALFYVRSAASLNTDVYIAEAISIGKRHISNEVMPVAQRKSLANLMVSLYGRAPDSAITEAGLDALAEAFPNEVKFLINVAAGYLRNANLDKAEAVLAKLLAKSPKSKEIVYRLAGVLAQSSRVQDALNIMATAVDDQHRDALFHARMGHFKAWSGDYSGAIPHLRTALAMDGYLSTALADLSLCYDLQQEPVLAFDVLKSALVAAAIKPPSFLPGIDEVHPRFGKRRLLQLAHATGQSGFAQRMSKEIRSEVTMTMPFRIEEWISGAFTGKRVMAITDSDVGDEIRYTSAYDLHFSDAASVQMTCDPRLLSIMSRSFPQYEFFPVQRTFQRVEGRRADVRRREVAPHMRPLVTDDVVDAAEKADIIARNLDIFETTSFGRDDVAASKTLAASADLRREYRAALDAKRSGRPVVGLSWRGGHHSYSQDPHYFSVETWKPILDMEEFSFVNLQYMLRNDELEYLRSTLGDRFIEFPDLDLMDDFEGMAAICSELDSMVAICTTILELAGAVGCDIVYLMRSPQITHSIRLAGAPDKFGSYADNVWSTCRIFPKFNINEEQVVERAVEFYRSRFTKH